MQANPSSFSVSSSHGYVRLCGSRPGWNFLTHAQLAARRRLHGASGTDCKPRKSPGGTRLVRKSVETASGAEACRAFLVTTRGLIASPRYYDESAEGGTTVPGAKRIGCQTPRQSIRCTLLPRQGSSRHQDWPIISVMKSLSVGAHFSPSNPLAECPSSLSIS